MNDIKKNYELVYNSKTFERIASTFDLNTKRVLDLGCGYGEYMQRFGAGSVGITTTQAEVNYGKSQHIDIRFGNVERLEETIKPDETFDVFWGNNLFEHLLSPHTFLVKLKNYAKDDSLLILGVPLIPKIQSLTKLSKFRGALASPHINFFTKRTCELTLLRAGWEIKSIRSFYFSSSIFDAVTNELMPHLYFVSKNNSSYRYPRKKIGEWEADVLYAELLKIMESN